MKTQLMACCYLFVIYFLSVSASHGLLDVDVIGYGNIIIVPGEPISNQEVGEVQLVATEPYQVRLSSANSSQLMYNQYGLPYTLRYNNSSPISLTPTPTMVEQGSDIRDVAARLITISIAGDVSLRIPAGNYSDTLTIEIVAR